MRGAEKFIATSATLRPSDDDVSIVALIGGQNCPTASAELGMDKRDRFIAELRDAAKALGLPFSVNKKRGKGGHVTVYCGNRLTTLPSREIDPATASKIRKHLGLV